MEDIIDYKTHSKYTISHINIKINACKIMKHRYKIKTITTDDKYLVKLIFY